ncbi:MAG TPA: hypothetical protein VF624_18445 [Tepidisphaeraceae bacterium]|jgi:hypothetical protein
MTEILRTPRRFSLGAVALAAALTVGAAFSPALAQDTTETAKREGESRNKQTLPPGPAEKPTPRTGEAFTFSAGLDTSSHFISFGADVWGGGDDANPFGQDSTRFAYGTVNAKVSNELSLFLNLWSDINNNAEDTIGGHIQEIDVNAGLSYKFGEDTPLTGFTLGLAHTHWIFAGETENAVEVSLAYADTGKYDSMGMGADFGLNPSVLLHYRYDVIGGQEDDVAVLQLGVRPTFTFNAESEYPITLAVPAAVAFFLGEYQGGDDGFGYANIGLSASVPLAFIPVEYGAWTAGATAVFWHTPDDSIPTNPEENFVVTSLSVGVSF